MSNKYQIFISSTYTDLERERAQVIKAILEMGHIPVGMEMFSAADEEQWKLIARQIDETDYYVVIVGHRYGSITEGISYTEKEFDYAATKGIPILGFVVSEDVEPLAKNTESDAKKKVGLNKFKAKVKQRPVGFFKSVDELHGKVSIALMKAFNTTPRTGWTRATSVAGPEIMQELSRLSKENFELRQTIDSLSKQEEKDLKAQRQQKIDTLKTIPKTLNLREAGKATWDISVETNLLAIFSTLGPDLMVEKSATEAGIYLAVMFNPDSKVKLSANAPYAKNHIAALLADFASMDLIEPSKKKHPVADKEHYWTLTQEGLEVLKLYRATRLEVLAANAALKENASKTEGASKQPKS